MRFTAMRSLFAAGTLLFACSIPSASAFQADAAADAKAIKVRLILQDFRYAEKSPALETIGGFLPGLLRASLFRYRWIELADGGPQADLVPRKETVASVSQTPAFLVEGSLVPIKDKVRLSLSAKDASNDALVFSNSAVFAGDTVVQEVDALAGLMAVALAAKVGAAGRNGSVIAVVSPFQAAGEPGKFQALATLVPDTLVTLLKRAQRETGNPPDTRFLEIFQTPARDAYDAVLTGAYSTDSGGLTVSAELREKRGPILRFSFRAAPDEALEIPDFLARRVSELLLGRITETGGWREEPLLAAAEADYAKLAAEADRRFNAKAYPPGIVLYRKAIELRPREQTPRFRLAEIYLTQKDYAAALSEYLAVLRVDPASARAVYGKGNVYLAQGRNLAAAAFQKALELAPGDRAIAIGSHKGLGDLELLQGRYEQAVLHYGAAQAIAEKAFNSRPGTPAAVADIDIYRSIGKTYLAAEQPQKAIAYLAGAIPRFPSSAELKNDLAGAYIQSGNDLVQAGKYLEAQKAFRAALAIPPENAGVQTSALVGLGDCLSRAGNNIEAIKYLQQAVSRDPKNEYPLRVLGAVYIDLKRYDEAIASFQNAIAIEPAVASYALLGESYRLKEKYDLAEESMRDALRLGPTNYHVYVMLARVYFDNQKYPPALENLQKAIALDPKQESAYMLIVATYAKLKDFPRAIENQSILVKISPSADTYYVLASMYWRNKDHAAALDALRKSIAIDPDYKDSYDLFRTVCKESAGLDPYIRLLDGAVRANPAADWLQMRLGEAYYDAGRYRDSIGPLSKAVSLASQKSDLELRLGMAYHKTGQLDLAISAIERSIRSNPEDTDAYSELAAIHDERGGRQKYVEFLVQLVAKEPGSLSARIKLGDEYRRQRKYDQAIDVLKQALSIDTENSEPYDGLDAIYYERGEQQKYLEFLAQLAADKPGSLYARVKLGDEYRRQHKYDQAINVLAQATSINPKSEWPWRALGIAYKARRDYEKALGALGKANDLGKTQWSFYHIADLLRIKGEYSKALENIDQALQLDSTYVDAYTAKAGILFDQKKPGDAIALLEGVRPKFSSSPEIPATLAWYYNNAHDYSKAVESCRAALAISPKYAYAYQLLASAQQQQGQYAAAMDSVRDAIRYDPADEDAYLLLKNLYHKLDKDAEGIAVLKGFLGQQPRNIGLLSALGFAEHEYAADFAGAYERYSTVYKLDRSLLNVKENFAEASLTTGRFDQALELAQAALSDRSLSPQQKLSMNLISITAQLLLGRRGNAFSEVGEFLRYYRSIPQDYERTWVYEGMKKYVDTSSLAPPVKELVLTLIATLEAPRQEGKERAEELANSLDRRLHELGQ
jgi:tetratricopeptide (TPR) repeat protein